MNALIRLLVLLSLLAIAYSGIAEEKSLVKTINYGGDNSVYFDGSFTNYKANNEALHHNHESAAPFSIAAGFHLTPFLATEVSYLFIPAATDINNNVNMIQNSYNALTFALKGTLAIKNTGLNLFAKIGPALNFRSKTSLLTSIDNNYGADQENGGFLYGVGLEYKLKDELAFSMQYFTTLESLATPGSQTQTPYNISHNFGVLALHLVLP